MTWWIGDWKEAGVIEPGEIEEIAKNCGGGGGGKTTKKDKAYARDSKNAFPEM